MRSPARQEAQHFRAPPLILLRLSACGDVHVRAQSAQGSAVHVAFHHQAPVQDPAPRPILVAQPVLGLVEVAAPGEVFIQNGLRMSAVVGMEQPLPRTDVGFDVFGGIAQHRRPAATEDHRSARNVPVPEAELTGLQGDAQPLFAGAQARLHPRALAHVARGAGDQFHRAVRTRNRREDVLVHAEDTRPRRPERHLSRDRLSALHHLRDLAHVHVVMPGLEAEFEAGLADHVLERQPQHLQQAPVRILEPPLRVEDVDEIGRGRRHCLEQAHLPRQASSQIRVQLQRVYRL